MLRIVVCLFIVMCTAYLSAQNPFRIVFYNVENLFDTKDNPETDDDDWLPKGNQRWSNYRYWQKLKGLSAAIDSIGENYPPALIGLCEVENDSVLFDLCKRSPLKKHKYRYIITKSKDDRGMNVALLYQRDEMKLLTVKEYTPNFSDAPDKHTRNVLHVTGLVISGDTLDIFICHFPSRVDGIKRTRPFRQQAARLLRQQVDKVMARRVKANVIIMGDFNDFPNDDSMLKILAARSMSESLKYKNLYNMFLDRIKESDTGSYKYRGKWQFMDQFVVNGNLLNSVNTVSVTNNTAKVFSGDFLLENDEKYGGKKPFRTYVWRKYLGGLSDHLPIYLDLRIKE
ncbi:endonuclease/exonuclease/phosphatase family protein [Dysgonomonas massiliensis]|uniref:endonuclease/exonuclease/phosphatase family protein n=1 Tax=Dysgonomonas massiliensis TaxID=2040292 RepID=UPI001FE7E65B|nr:endonuclease/exonuclease/phosphatase family protein [Dysgonomonas massiliensis]